MSNYSYIKLRYVNWFMSVSVLILYIVPRQTEFAKEVNLVCHNISVCMFCVLVESTAISWPPIDGSTKSQNDA